MSEVVVPHLAPLVEAMDGVGASWLNALGGAFPSAVVDDDVDAMSDAGLLGVNQTLAAVARHVQALQARVANGISRRSTPEKGSDGLSRKAGFRTPEKLIAATTGGHPADAKKLIQVGDATAGRMTFTGERAPARHPEVAAAVESGTLSVGSASAIAGLLDKVACRADRTALQQAERTLVEQAAGLSLAEVHVLLRRAEAWIDPDGLEPKIENLRQARYLKIWEDRQGMIVIDGKLDPATGAPIKAAVEGLVTAQIRAMRGRNRPDTPATPAIPAGQAATQSWTWGGEGTVAGQLPHDETDAGTDAGVDAGTDAGAGAGADPVGPVERRTVQQLQADALAALAKHSLGCDQTALPLASTTVVVRIPLDTLTTGTGVATIDGIAQPVDAGTARRMAADAEIIPIVLGARSEVLDCGRTRRLFTKAQRLSLWERDGGCAGCGAPPGMTEAHHLIWWSRGGTTDLNNAVLLCTSCHHSIHQDGWDIQVDGPHVWLIPPAHIDPTRTPRPGGRQRHDYQAAA
jgi:hypothetical protein